MAAAKQLAIQPGHPGRISLELRNLQLRIVDYVPFGIASQLSVTHIKPALIYLHVAICVTALHPGALRLKPGPLESAQRYFWLGPKLASAFLSMRATTCTNGSTTSATSYWIAVPSTRAISFGVNL